MDKDTTVTPWESCDDELERLALEEYNRRRLDPTTTVLVMPAGRCGLATRFARLGARVIVADAPEMRQDVLGRALAAGQQDNIAFLPGHPPAVPADIDAASLDIVFLRRGLCSQTYAQSKQSIRDMLGKLKIGGKLYLSILGIHSELGDGYPGREQSIYERMARLSPGMVQKYGIHDEVCLYSERDLFLLLLESGASVLRTMTTTWGNVKAVAVRV